MAVLDKLDADIVQTLQAADVRQRVADLVIEPAPSENVAEDGGQLRDHRRDLPAYEIDGGGRAARALRE